MKNYLKGIITGLLLSIIMFSTVVYGATESKLVELFYPEVKIYLNGVLKVFSNKPVIYNNRIYVPLRAISELLGNDVGWYPETNSVYIGVQPYKEKVELSSLSPVSVAGYWDSNNKVRLTNQVKIGGRFYDKVMYSYATAASMDIVSRADYRLNRQYKKIEGTFAITDDSNDSPMNGEVTFLTDGVPLYVKKLSNSDEPISFSIEVANVEHLAIIVQKYNYGAKQDAGLGMALLDVNLYTK